MEIEIEVLVELDPQYYSRKVTLRSGGNGFVSSHFVNIL